MPMDLLRSIFYVVVGEHDIARARVAVRVAVVDATRASLAPSWPGRQLVSHDACQMDRFIIVRKEK